MVFNRSVFCSFSSYELVKNNSRLERSAVNAHATLKTPTVPAFSDLRKQYCKIKTLLFGFVAEHLRPIKSVITPFIVVLNPAPKPLLCKKYLVSHSIFYWISHITLQAFFGYCCFMKKGAKMKSILHEFYYGNINPN